jgi:hypothetical protein
MCSFQGAVARDRGYEQMMQAGAAINGLVKAMLAGCTLPFSDWHVELQTMTFHRSYYRIWQLHAACYAKLCCLKVADVTVFQIAQHSTASGQASGPLWRMPRKSVRCYILARPARRPPGIG